MSGSPIACWTGRTTPQTGYHPISRFSRLWDFQIGLWDFQIILKPAVAANTSVQASNLDQLQYHLEVPCLKPLIWTSFNIIWKSHVWKSHSLERSVQLANGYRDPETQSNGSHYSLATHAKPYSVGSPNQVRLVSSTGQSETGYHLELCLEVP
jgi:hypothetical protein